MGDGAADVDPDRDARTIRRALRAGLVVGPSVAALLLALGLAAGASGREGLALVLLGGIAGLLTTTGWLVLAAVLDVLADEPPGRRRTLLTVVLAVASFVSPALVVGAVGAGGGG